MRVGVVGLWSKLREKRQARAGRPVQRKSRAVFREPLFSGKERVLVGFG